MSLLSQGLRGFVRNFEPVMYGVSAAIVVCCVVFLAPAFVVHDWASPRKDRYGDWTHASREWPEEKEEAAPMDERRCACVCAPRP